MTTFIAVAGGIGAGKSSLIDFLKQHFGLVPFYEKNQDNPFLEDFYGDMKRYAFPSQVWFLAQKFRTHQRIGRLRKPAILDRTIYEDAEVFALSHYRLGWMSKREYRTYSSLYQTVCRSLPAPDLLIFLKASVRTQKKRIALRGRPMEQSIEPAYLKRVNRLYREWLRRWEGCKVLTVDADRLDFVADLVHQADLLSELKQRVPGIPKRR